MRDGGPRPAADRGNHEAADRDNHEAADRDNHEAADRDNHEVGDEDGADDQDDVDLAETIETVDEAVERVIRELGAAIVRRPAQGGTELAVDGRPFAVIAPGLVEVQLDPAVAAAALRTPDVTPGDRGRGWVRLTPPRDSRSPLDVDRAVAWLRHAHRAALGRH